jgi:PAS domain S-box-containing protein
VELSPTGIAIYQYGNFVYINKAGLAIMGCNEPVELLGKPVLSIVHPESRKAAIKRMLLVERGASVPPLEEKLIRSDGSIFDAEVTSISTTFNDKPAAQVLVTDISVRKLADKKLRESEAKYRLLSEEGGIGIGLYSEEGKILFFNNRAIQNLGGKSEDYIGKSLTEVFGQKAGEEYINRTRRTIKSGKSYDYEDFFESPTGKYWFLSNFSIVTDSNGQLIGVQVLAHDITERKKAEDALRQANEYNRTLIEASLDPLVTIGTDGKILDVNKATQNITGLKRGELIGTEFSNYFTEPEHARDGYKEVFSKGFVKDYPLELKSRKGKIVPVLYNATLYRDEDGNVAGVFAAARDISERKKVEEKLKRSAREFRELSKHVEDRMENERTQIAHNLHDDLGQKLTALNMNIAWLKSRIGVQSKGVQNMLWEMNQLLNDSLETTKKISYGLRPSILDDLGLLAAIEWQLTDFKKTTGIVIDFIFNLGDILFDKEISLTIFRIIQETLTNIVRHSKATEVKLKLNSGRKSIKLSITDNGIGIKKSQVTSPRSFGLIGMIERAKSCGGKLSIKVRKQSGTEVIMEIPVIDTTP